jgi:uncharacterized membrane protein YfcA
MHEFTGSFLVIFLIGTFTAAFVTGLAGFAFGMVAAAIWLHALSPVQVTALIVFYALLVQSHAVWKIRQVLNMRRLLPFIAGSAVGIPAGIGLLTWATPASLRLAVGVLLIAFSLYNLLRPKLPVVTQAQLSLDSAVGVCNGILAGSTGLAGILPMIWSGMRGWAGTEQRAVFQPTAVATFLMMIAWMGGTATLTLEIGRLFVIGLPALAAGTWLGWKLYGRLDEALFRKLVLWLLLASGAALVVNAL